MIKVYVSFIISVLLFSCGSKTCDYEKFIQGDWEIIPFIDTMLHDGERTPPPLPRYVGDLGFYFGENGICENKVGYFDYTEIDDVGRRLFLGTETRYKIVQNTLQIFDLEENDWQIFEIQKITNDSLILLYEDKFPVKFIKRHYKIDPETSFDKIIVSTYGCYGTCPISDIIISKTGDVVFYERKYTTATGAFKSRIKKEDFAKIEKNFKKAEYQNLENSYSNNASDLMAISVTFIKDDKIIKSIIDYGAASPTEFKRALYPLVYLEQKLKLEKVDFNTVLIDLDSGRFKSSTAILKLSKPELFYLNSELQNAKESEIAFTSKYILSSANIKDKKIVETDGRFFKIELSNSKFITLDLGYNFFEQNNFSAIFD